MKFMLLCYDDEAAWNKAGEAVHRAAMNEAVQLCHELAARGQYITASPLQPVSTATSVRVRDGKRIVTDGPFAETREILGGYYVIDVPGIEEAIRVAARHPGVLPHGVEPKGGAGAERSHGGVDVRRDPLGPRIAEAQRAPPNRFDTWRLRREVDRAARRAATAERGRGSLDDLDLLEVERVPRVGADVPHDLIHRHPASFVKRVRRVAPRTTQVAGGQADEDAGTPGVRRFSLNRMENLVDRQHRAAINCTPPPTGARRPGGAGDARRTADARYNTLMPKPLFYLKPT